MSEGLCVLWLKAMSVVTIAFGLVAAAASHPAGQTPWLLLFDLLAWPMDGKPAAFSAETFAVNAVAGGVMAGWGVLMYGLSAGPIARGDRDVRRMVMAGLTVWFVVDSTGSWAAGMIGNIVLNIVFLVLFLIPLVALRSAGQKTPRAEKQPSSASR